jgi:signal transduction histidine kinase
VATHGLSLEDLPGPACVLAAERGEVGAHNEAFAAWAGRGELKGVALADLLPGDPGARRLFREARALGVAEHHVERRDADGACSFWILRARRIEGGVLLCAGEVSALAEAAQAMHAAERSYVAVASHELRAPLAAIKAWASALGGRAREKGGAPGNAEIFTDGLAAIARQVDRMDELLGDLFAAAESGSGALHAERARVDVGELVRAAVTSSPHAARAVVGAIPPANALVDRAHLEAVIGRVLAWIALRTPEGPIAVDAERGENGETLVLFADRGPALARRAEGELFGRTARGGRGRGGGVGLYLCQQLAAASGARVFRERGRFVVALPADRLPDRLAGGPPRVLVGDADATRLSRALSALRLEGHEATGAATLDLLVEGAEEGAYDVVVADAALPGFELASLARLAASASSPAIVLISPSAERPPALEGAERAGALAVLPRPVDWPHLGSLVHCAAAARMDARGLRQVGSSG